MRKCFSICLLIAVAVSSGWSQTTPVHKAAPAKKPAAAAAQTGGSHTGPADCHH